MSICDVFHEWGKKIFVQPIQQRIWIFPDNFMFVPIIPAFVHNEPVLVFHLECVRLWAQIQWWINICERFHGYMQKTGRDRHARWLHLSVVFGFRSFRFLLDFGFSSLFSCFTLCGCIWLFNGPLYLSKYIYATWQSQSYDCNGIYGRYFVSNSMLSMSQFACMYLALSLSFQELYSIAFIPQPLWTPRE